MFPLVTKLLLGHATVFEAPLRKRTANSERGPLESTPDEAELRRYVRSQAGAWERGARPCARPATWTNGPPFLLGKFRGLPDVRRDRIPA